MLAPWTVPQFGVTHSIRGCSRGGRGGSLGRGGASRCPAPRRSSGR